MGKVRGRTPPANRGHHAPCFFFLLMFFDGNTQRRPSPSPVFISLRPSPVVGGKKLEKCSSPPAVWILDLLSRERALRCGEPQTSRAWKLMGREDELGPSSCRFARSGARTVSVPSPCYRHWWPLSFSKAWGAIWSTSKDAHRGQATTP